MFAGTGAVQEAVVNLSDEALMARVQAGETPLFGELARRYRAALLRAAESRLGAAAGAEDAVQEALLSAFKSRATFDPRYSFRTWLWTILLNQCRSDYSRRQRELQQRQFQQREMQQRESQAVGPQRSSGWERDFPAVGFTGGSTSAEAVADQRDAPDFAAAAREQRETLNRLLAQLDPNQADALRLRFFGALRFHEIAAAMQCSLPTAKNRVRAGLMQLARRIKPLEDDPG